MTTSITKSSAKAAPAIPAVSLDDIKTHLETLRDQHIAAEDAFHAQMLPTRLKMGLYCLKAHAHFAITDKGKQGQGRKKKEIVSTVDTISPGGFEGWLADALPWMKRPTAYRYMTAVKGLALKGEQLTEAATEQDVDKALQFAINIAETLEAPKPTLKSLFDAAIEPVAPKQLGDNTQPEQQQEFEFLRSRLSHFRVEGESILSIKDQLKGVPEMHRAACARAYAILSDLTGTNWMPSDEPNELASVDPDSLAL